MVSIRELARLIPEKDPVEKVVQAPEGMQESKVGRTIYCAHYIHNCILIC